MLSEYESSEEEILSSSSNEYQTSYNGLRYNYSYNGDKHIDKEMYTKVYIYGLRFTSTKDPRYLVLVQLPNFERARSV